MESKLFFMFFLVFSSWVFVGFSQSDVDESRTGIDQLTQSSEDFDSLTRNLAGFSQSDVDESRTGIDQLTKSSENLDSLTRNLAGLLGQGTAYAHDLGPSMQCMQKLLPCQPYLHSSSPPATCCAPLEEMVANETECLCSVFDNPGILKNFNLTQDDALNLAKNCGSKADISLCKNAISPVSSPSAPSDHASTNSSTPSDSSSEKSAAHPIAHFGGLSLVVISMALAFSAY